MDGLLSRSKKEKPYLSPPEENFLTPPHTSRDELHEMSSSERRQYNKALRAMYEIVRLGSKRLAKPLADDNDNDDDEEEDDVIPETVTETSDNEGDLNGEYVRWSGALTYDNILQRNLKICHWLPLSCINCTVLFLLDNSFVIGIFKIAFPLFVCFL